jgi:hypothetical protein
VIPISPCGGRLKFKEWLVRKQSKYWVTIPSMRQSKPFLERPSEKLSSDLLAFNSKQYRLVTGL